MKRLLVFDLDSTLAPIGKGIGDRELEIFRRLEKNHVKIAICSGKTCDYLCGFMRQVGLKNPILIGENGAVIRIGTDLPPKVHYRVPFSKDAADSLKKIRKILEEEFPHIWFQPNKTGVTPFPTTQEEFDKIEGLLQQYSKELKNVAVFRHVDSFDIVPAEINKAKGIACLLELLNLSKEDVIAIGDGVNDYEMFEMAYFSMGVNVKEKERVDINFRTTMEMLEFAEKLLGLDEMNMQFE